MSENRRSRGPEGRVWLARAMCGISLVLLIVSSGWAQKEKPKGSSHAYLGILVGPNEAGARGVQVRDVTPDSPAAKAGMKTGDRILKIDNADARDARSFF